MSAKIGEAGGSYSVVSDYSYSNDASETSSTSANADLGNSIEQLRSPQCPIGETKTEAATPEFGDLTAGLFALLGCRPEASGTQGSGDLGQLGETLGFLMNLASLVRSQDSGDSDGAATRALMLIGQEAMRQACDDDSGPLTELAQGKDVSGSFEKRVGWRAEGKGQTTGALGTASGRYLVAAEARTTGHGQAHVGLDGARASGDIYAGVRAEAEAEGSLESKPIVNVGNYPVTLNAHGKAEAQAGAFATANGNAVLSPLPPEAAVHGEAGAFAGARAGVTGDVGAGPLKGKGFVEGWAGVGAKANCDIGFHDGKFTIEYGAGAALGLGCAYGGAMEVDIAAPLEGIFGALGGLAGSQIEKGVTTAMNDKKAPAAAASGAPAQGPSAPAVQVPAVVQPTGLASEEDEARTDEDVVRTA